MQALLSFDLQFASSLIGVDEVGRGCLAGPVFAGAVHFPSVELPFDWLREVNDSKKLPAKRREYLAAELKQVCTYSIGEASPAEINEFGILPSTLLAMRRAVEGVVQQSEKQYLVLVDGISKIKNFPFEQKTIKKGDSTSLHIAAASIIAKVARDNYMKELSQSLEFAPFGWERNAGYGTKVHCEALLKYGPTKQHRVKFLRKIFNEQA